MLTKDLREQTRKAAKTRKHKMGARLIKGEKKNAKRAATEAAGYTIVPLVRKPEDLIPGNDSEQTELPRPRPERKRLWASLEKTPEEVIQQEFKEAGCRDPGHRKKWVALVDGNKPQIRLLRRMAKEKGLDLTIIVDIVHVTEYLIATGVIEGACRQLVKDRLEVTGARWSLNGAEAVLRLRALRSSHDIDEYWTFHEVQEYERNHRSLYAGGIVPPTLKPHSRYLSLTAGVTLNKPSSGKLPSVTRTWPWGLNPRKSPKVWMAMAAPGMDFLPGWQC